MLGQIINHRHLRLPGHPPRYIARSSGWSTVLMVTSVLLYASLCLSTYEYVPHFNGNYEEILL